MNTKYIFITGGVVSGLGKGITAASLGRLLKNRGYDITIQKFDPYINIDPGTMNPYEHGEVFVTDDGAETDLDLGHYERFIDESLTKDSSVTMRQIYKSVIEKERKGKYLGKTVQVIPHITDEIKSKIYSFDGKKDIVITEVGGTIGDIEGLSIIEAIRQVGLEKNKEDVLYIHVTLLPYISGSNEIKTKPTQHSVKELQSYGIKPDILVCRSDIKIDDQMKEKISLFCNVRKTSVIENMTVDNLYKAPLMLEENGLGREVCNHMRLDNFVPNNLAWEHMINNIEDETVLNIAIVGKYVKLEDSYLSVIESIKHASFQNKVKPNITLISSEKISEKNVEQKLKGMDAIIVPGGFGTRGIDGKILAIKYARQNNVPFLGICLGMQLAIIEFARNVLNIQDANSSELMPNCKENIIDIMEEQKQISKMGGTMRLGAYSCKLQTESKAYKLYNEEIIEERHRHRYEFNNKYKKQIEDNGLLVSGINEKRNLVEIVELKDHPYFIATQFHPELKSRPNKPAPLFNGLIKEAKNIKENRVKQK